MCKHELDLCDLVDRSALVGPNTCWESNVGLFLPHCVSSMSCPEVSRAELCRRKLPWCCVNYLKQKMREVARFLGKRPCSRQARDSARHASYGVSPEHLAVLGQALVQTLQRCLGDSFTPEVEMAWTVVYNFVSASMIAGLKSTVPPAKHPPKQAIAHGDDPKAFGKGSERLHAGRRQAEPDRHDPEVGRRRNRSFGAMRDIMPYGR